MFFEDLHDRIIRGSRRIKQVRDAMEVVRAENNVDKRGPLGNQISVFLGETSADGNLEVRFRVFERLEARELPVELLIGVLSNATGIEEDQVRIFRGRCSGHAILSQEPSDPLRIMLIHLTPVGADEVFLRRIHGGESTGRRIAAP